MKGYTIPIVQSSNEAFTESEQQAIGTIAATVIGSVLGTILGKIID